MHELPIINSVLKIVLAEAQKNNAKKVVTIRLRVGVLSDLQDEWMQRYFDYMSKDTIAKGATLKIERTPAVMKCAGCSHEFNVTLNDLDGLQCPKCCEKKMNLVSGREYYIEAMEVR